MRAFLIALVVAAGFRSSGQDAAPYFVEPNVLVSSGNSRVRHYESYACADSKRANRLVAGAYVVHSDGKIDNVFYVSLDRGRTWFRSLTVQDAVDPSCAITANGEIFAANIHDQAFPDGKTYSVLSVYRSRDDGRSWQAPSNYADTRRIDRAYVTADDTLGRFSGRVYVHGYLFSKNPPATALFYRSTDAGTGFVSIGALPAATFAKPWFFPGNGVVTRDGKFFALFAELDDSARNMSYRTDLASAPHSADAVLDVYRSDDGGATVNLAGTIPDVYYDWRIPQLSMPVLAVDRSGGRFHGRLYVAWPDARGDRRTKILFSYSTDQGRTWSPPGAVGDDYKGSVPNKQPNDFMPALAVNKDGIVGIAWYDRRDNPDNIGYWVRFAASLDGGASWLPSERVSTASHVATGDTRKNSGDTAGLAADAGGAFHPVWIDNRTGIPQVWTTTVRVRSQTSRR